MKLPDKKNIKAHRNESGQAFTELCISLIPLLCVMLFLIYFAGISITSIDVLLEARGAADTNAVNGTQTLSQLNIVRSWQYGHDQEDDSMAAAYFQDDIATGSSSVNEEAFIDQINGGDFSPVDFAERVNFQEYAPFSRLAGGDLFLDAAELTSGSANTDRDNVATLGYLENSSERAELDETFDYLLPGDGLMARLNAKEQRTWKSNQVYMPITE
jgi:hypothetical protein